MSFLFPRTISITRPEAPDDDPDSDVGLQPYQGVRTDTEEPIASGVPASIQLSGMGKNAGEDLPNDALSPSEWRIFIPKAALAKGTVSERDIVTDDLGKRYQVSAAYWHPMGHSMRASLLQV